MGKTGRMPKKSTQRNREKRTRLTAKKPTGRQRAPALPKRTPAWTPATKSWWKSVWASPVAERILDLDRWTLLRIADLVERFNRCPTDDPSLATKLASEIRLAQKDFGFTPGDRDRMRWDVEEDEPKASSKKKKTRTEDPRDFLRDLEKEER